jgi:leader peptidase (prepilin peptidase) / N-methyltransferase
MSSFVFLSVLSGLLVGLIVNYLADVLTRNRRFTLPVCLTCGETRSMGEFLIGAECSSCGKKNALRYWLILAFSVVLSVLVWIYPVKSLPFWASEIMLLIFLVIITTDMEYRVILQQMSITAYLAAIFIGLFLHGWLKTLLGGLSGFALFLGFYYLGKLFAHRLSRNREEPVDEEALGFGDVHMAGIIGSLSGFPFVFPALLVAIILGGIVSALVILVSVIRKNYQAFQAIPYGPFIIIGGIFALYFYF